MNNSMINPSITELLEKVEDRYSLVIVTSRRARQIIDGSKPLTSSKSKTFNTCYTWSWRGTVSYHKNNEVTE